MPEPTTLSVGALLAAGGAGIAKGAGAVLGKGAVEAWRASRRVASASKNARAAAVRRHRGWPGVELALATWAQSPAFDNLLLDAALGNVEALTEGRVVRSFVANGGAGWSSDRAVAVTGTFLTALFDELAKGEEGQALALRLDDARERQARIERGEILDETVGARSAAEEAVANTRDIGATLTDLVEEVRRVAPPSGEVPPIVETAIQGGVFDEISRHFAAGEPDRALDLADRLAERVEEALNDDGDRYAAALRPYRQRLLLAASNAASYRLDAATARDRARAALALGPIDPRLHPQAVQALFNATLPDDLRRLAAEIPVGTSERDRASTLLAFLDSDWDAAAEGLAALDHLTLLVEAEVARIDPTDPDGVRHVAALLDSVADEADAALDALAVARVTLRLLGRVLDGGTPLAFERRPLTDAVAERALKALDATAPGSVLRAHATSTLREVGLLLADGPLLQRSWDELQALPESVRGHVVFALDHDPTPTETAAEVEAGRISPAQAAVRTARVHLDAGDVTAAIETLREGLFQAHDVHERVQTLGALVEILRADGRPSEAEAALDMTPVPPAARWRLAQHDGRPLDLEGARAFPLDPRVLRLVAERLLAETPARESALGRDLFETGRDREPPSDVVEDRPSAWTRRLVTVLPARSARLLHAEALFHDAEYDDLLVASVDLDPVFDPRPAELRAFALQGLGRLSEAAETMTQAANAAPGTERVAVNAAALWLALGEGEQAQALLAPLVDAGTETVGVLVNYATALRQTDLADSEAASRAFDLYRRAFEAAPSKPLAMRAWMAARVAGRESEAGDLFRAMTADAVDVVVDTAEDARRVLTEDRGAAFTRFSGNIEAFAEAIADQARKDREATDALNRFAGAHAIADADAFRASGRPWENWARRTLDAQRRSDAQGYGVLADWPSSSHVFGRRQDPAPNGLYADLTALLTLGVLGPDTAATLLAAAAPVHVAAGTLDRLADERLRLEHGEAATVRAGDAAAVERLDGSDAIMAYDADVEARAPDAPDLGAARVDLGVAVDLGGRYVTDLDRDLPDPARDVTLRSVTLLQTLHYEGRVEREAAVQAAHAHPGTFGGWAEADPLDEVPPVLVFDRFALADWAATGLLDALGEAIRVGPWAWGQLLGEARDREAATLAYHRLRDTLSVLRRAAADGHLVEIDPVAPPTTGAEGPDDEESVEGIWQEALQAVRTAQAHDLQLWADDRFYPLLLWLGGPVIDGPATQAALRSLTDAGELPLPVPTVDLAARLARDGGLSDADARDIAGRLFDQGYRPAHPLALADALARFPVPPNPPLKGRAATLVDAVRAIPTYLPDTIALPRRQGFARAAAAEVASQFVTLAWTHPGLDEPQRRVLADAFLDAVEAVFAEQSPEPDAPRSDRTRLFFWRGLSSTLFTASFEGEEAIERQDAALRWLGDAAARRPDPLRDIVRLLEDNAPTAVALTPDAQELADVLAASGRADVDPQAAHARAAGGFAFRALVPLLGSALVDGLDPLLRRTVGWLGRLDRGGRIDAHVSALHDGLELATVIPEEEDEGAALELIRRVARGEADLAGSVRATDLHFVHHRRPPDDWVAAGMPADSRLPVEVRVSLVTLLWADAPDVHPAIVAQLVYQLSRIDPPLALRLLDVRDDLWGDDPDRRDAARDALALAVLQSGFFELQRDLGHGAWRVRDWPVDRLRRFLGWVGADDAQRLATADADTAGHVVALGDVVVSQAHLFSRQLLTDTFSDRDAVLAAVGDSLTGGASAPVQDLEVWVANRRETVETSDDPFVAAYALRHVLLALRAGFDDPDACAWVSDYLATALSDLDAPANPLEARLDLRRRLARSALLLATFATYGAEHLDAYNDEEDPLQEWLDGVWLFTSRLLDALPALHGGLAPAVAEAERAVADLGLETPSAQVLDAFDPFVFAQHDDIGRTLTLAALRSALDPEAPPPTWWSPDLGDRVAALAERPLSAEHPSLGEDAAEDVGDRFGLGAPLRERALARAVLARVQAVT